MTTDTNITSSSLANAPFELYKELSIEELKSIKYKAAKVLRKKTKAGISKKLEAYENASEDLSREFEKLSTDGGKWHKRGKHGHGHGPGFERFGYGGPFGWPGESPRGPPGPFGPPGPPGFGGHPGFGGPPEGPPNFWNDEFRPYGYHGHRHHHHHHRGFHGFGHGHGHHEKFQGNGHAAKGEEYDPSNYDARWHERRQKKWMKRFYGCKFDPFAERQSLMEQFKRQFDGSSTESPESSSNEKDSNDEDIEVITAVDAEK